MKKLLIALLATTAMSAAIPAIAMAHPPTVDQDQGDDDSWNNGGASYDDFSQEYQHVWQGIQHGLSDGAYSRRQAASFYRAMSASGRTLIATSVVGNSIPRPPRGQLEQLHERMHNAHEDGHDRQDSYYSHDNSGYYNRR